MIGYLEGRLLQKNEDTLLINVGGVGYKVRVPSHVAAEAGNVGATVRLFIHTYVRENEISLYGFRTEEELHLFELLLGVSGIGPKVAITCLSTLDPVTITNAIVNEQADLLTRIPGIGKRTAQRIVLDLKNKVDMAGLEILPAATTDSDAIEALTALGYSIQEAQQALQGLPPDMPLEDKIFRALQRLAE